MSSNLGSTRLSAFNNVLVIEDNPGDARLVAGYLDEGLGGRCTVRQAATLADGLLALRQAVADVVLLDLGLPDSQGLGGYIEVSRQSPGTPVVILTGHHDEDDALDALRIGAEDYLAKHAVDGPSLIRSIRYAVERRQTHESLRRSEARFRAIVETAEEGILQLDRSGNVLYANSRAGEILGPQDVGPDHVLGLRELVSVGAHVAVEKLLATPVGSRISQEVQLLEARNEERWVLAAAGGIAVASGSDSEVVLLLTDISDLKRTEGELVQMRDHLERLVAERTVMLEAANMELRAIGRAMAHDLKTPLHGIIGMTHLIKHEAQDVLPTVAWKKLLLVEQIAKEMNDLISHLLSMASAGSDKVHRAHLDLSAMATAIVHRLEAADPDRRVLWKIEPGLTAQGDRILVADVLQNLMENAWKYSSRVANTVIAFGVEPNDSGPPVFFIRDNGVGFDMAQATKLFEAFERLPSARDYAGNGLGLSGAKRILARHGGSIWASSSPGSGSVFYFTLEPSGLTNSPSNLNARP